MLQGGRLLRVQRRNVHEDGDERVLRSIIPVYAPNHQQRLSPKTRVLTPTYCCPQGTIAGRSRLTKTCCAPSRRTAAVY